MPCPPPTPILSARRRSRRRTQRSLPHVSAQFDLSDPIERDAVRWVAAFHDGNVYRLLSLRRGRTEEGRRAIWMLTRSCAIRPGARPEWLVITFLLDETHVTLPSYRTLRSARAAFKEASHPRADGTTAKVH